MQATHLFEYAVIRIVPQVEREEYFNAGVILYCASQQFLQMRFEVSAAKLAAYGGELSQTILEARLASMAEICAGKQNGSSISSLPLASRFRWLAATRSTSIQVSPIHPGLCEHPQQALDKLFTALVL